MSIKRPPKPDVTYARLQKSAQKHVRRGDLQPAIAECERALASLSKTPYHRALGRSWQRQTAEAAKWLAAFYRNAAKSLRVKALYCEMTRFEINTDVWDAEAFAYDRFGDPDEPGLLVGWKRSTSKPLVLKGMKDLQRAYARDQAREDDPPAESVAASEAVSMLLTLRFQALIQAAAFRARSEGKLPEDVPVLAAVHDSDLLLACYGKIRPKPQSPQRPQPKAKLKPRSGGKRHIYELDIAWDEHGNSLPYDCLDFASGSEETKCNELLRRAGKMAAAWNAPRIRLRKRKWRNELLYLPGGAWAVTSKAKGLLQALLGKSVEFLPIACRDLECWALHPVRQIALGPRAIHDGHNGSNITQIEKHDFRPQDLRDLHLFRLQNAEGSPAARAGLSYRRYYCSSEFHQLLQEHDLQGAGFKKVFSYST